MWFKMSLEILNGAVGRDVCRARARREPHGSRRALAFIALLSSTAAGFANDLQDARDLARVVDTTEKQAQIVWDVLLKHGVLRKGARGYSAREWMIGEGILGDFSKKGEKQPKASGAQNMGYFTKSKNEF